MPNKMQDIDGNIYKTVQIGDQVWMAENLKVTHYRNGESIPNLESDTLWAFDTTGAYCVYNNDPALADTCGLLYNWYAVNNDNGLAPEGWHVPSDEEWKELEMFIGMSQNDADSIGNRGDVAFKLKSTYGWYWVSGSNDYGFNAFPFGHRITHFNFRLNSVKYNDKISRFWTSTDFNINKAWYRLFPAAEGHIKRYYDYLGGGNSIRCVKDD